MTRYLTTASVVACPHGGTVTGVPSQSEQLQDGYPILSSADVFVVAGCPAVDADGTPAPCLQVQWSTTCDLVVAWGHALDESSTGIALDASTAPRGTVTVLRA
jgi:hypothetical protein